MSLIDFRLQGAGCWGSQQAFIFVPFCLFLYERLVMTWTCNVVYRHMFWMHIHQWVSMFWEAVKSLGIRNSLVKTGHWSRLLKVWSWLWLSSSWSSVNQMPADKCSYSQKWSHSTMAYLGIMAFLRNGEPKWFFVPVSCFHEIFWSQGYESI